MARALMVAMLMAACANHDDAGTSQRIAEIERRLDEFKLVAIKLNKDDGEMIDLLEKYSTATTKLATSLAAVGVVNSDLEPEAAWWCNGLCYRRAKDCSTNHGTRAPEPCRRQRVAWCAAVFSSKNGSIGFACVPTRDACESLFSSCIGSE